ncbi:MmcQ/YjbR family DNA-binding protein [Escherichia coli]|uniref:MmcQ/YjbR family DNA-binding protein n=1 Tax=Escherichia coli TaxID=562 RepID=UPI000BE3EBC8|nr:MmcQ/YjbR family DNA-binding protein [Escherichia coli]
MKRKTLFKYSHEHFGTEPEYLWKKFPSYAVLRHQRGDKWFAIVMNVPGYKIGLKTEEEVDILDVKVRPEYIGSLRQKSGVYPAYHMNKEHWVSVLLEGPLPAEEIYELLVNSYKLTS